MSYLRYSIFYQEFSKILNFKTPSEEKWLKTKLLLKDSGDQELMLQLNLRDPEDKQK